MNMDTSNEAEDNANFNPAKIQSSIQTDVYKSRAHRHHGSNVDSSNLSENTDDVLLTLDSMDGDQLILDWQK